MKAKTAAKQKMTKKLASPKEMSDAESTALRTLLSGGELDEDNKKTFLVMRHRLEAANVLTKNKARSLYRRVRLSEGNMVKLLRGATLPLRQSKGSEVWFGYRELEMARVGKDTKFSNALMHKNIKESRILISVDGRFESWYYNECDRRGEEPVPLTPSECRVIPQNRTMKLCGQVRMISIPQHWMTPRVRPLLQLPDESKAKTYEAMKKGKPVLWFKCSPTGIMTYTKPTHMSRV